MYNHNFHPLGEFLGVLLEVRGYACQPYLLTPSPEPGRGRKEDQSCPCQNEGVFRDGIWAAKVKVQLPAPSQGDPSKGL